MVLAFFPEYGSSIQILFNLPTSSSTRRSPPWQEGGYYDDATFYCCYHDRPLSQSNAESVVPELLLLSNAVLMCLVPLLDFLLLILLFLRSQNIGLEEDIAVR